MFYLFLITLQSVILLYGLSKFLELKEINIPYFLHAAKHYISRQYQRLNQVLP